MLGTDVKGKAGLGAGSSHTAAASPAPVQDGRAPQGTPQEGNKGPLAAPAPWNTEHGLESGEFLRERLFLSGTPWLFQGLGFCFIYLIQKEAVFSHDLFLSRWCHGRFLVLTSS